MFISKMSKGIVRWTFRNLSDENRTRFNNGKTSIIELENRLKVLFLYIFVGITLLVASNWISKTELLLSLACVVSIRLWNGGHHFKPELCYLVTSGVIVGIPICNSILYVHDLGLVIFLWTTITMTILVPFKKMSRNNTYIRKLVIVLIITCSYYFNVEILTMALFLLSFDLIKYQRR